MIKGGMLSEVISPDRNNTDLIRLILACAVIFGHATTISPQAGYTDFAESLIGTNSSSVAVWLFFFLSGLLVTNSLLEKKSLLGFVVSRFFRIWPALIVLILLTTIIIGPFFTELTIKEYFLNNNTKGYFLRNIQLQQQYFLPGVFAHAPSREVVNGSLWSIPYEVYAYSWVFFLFFVGFLNRWICLLFTLLIVIDFLSPKPIFVLDRGAPLYLTLDFTIGCLFALWKDKVRLDLKTIFFLGFLCWFFKGMDVQIIFLHLFLFVSILYISMQGFFLKLKPKYDMSYGVYLWGYVVAQIWFYYFPDKTIYFHQFFSIVTALFIAYLSSVYIERPSVRVGVRLIKKLNPN